MSDLKNREDVIEYKKYEKLCNLLKKLRDDPNHPMRKPFFEALAQGQGFRIGGHWWQYVDLLFVFYIGSARQCESTLDNIILNIMNEEGLIDGESI